MSCEAHIVKRILAYLKERGGGFWFKVVGGPFQMAGLPDIVGCYHGLFVAFEVKTLRGKATRLQLAVIELIQRAGGSASVVTSARQVKDILDVLDDSD